MTTFLIFLVAAGVGALVGILDRKLRRPKKIVHEAVHYQSFTNIKL